LGLSLDKNLPPLERDLTRLLYDLCVDWGFCIPPVDAQRIARSKSVTARDFAHEVLRAEGMNPEYEVEWVRRIAARFVEHFGSGEVAEGQLS
jgi:hypothetical protein